MLLLRLLVFVLRLLLLLLLHVPFHHDHIALLLQGVDGDCGGCTVGRLHGELVRYCLVRLLDVRFFRLLLSCCCLDC